MPDFKITSHPLTSATAVTKIAGEVEAIHFDTVMEEMEKLANSGVIGLIVDVSETRAMNCPAFGAFTHMARVLKGRQGKFVLAGPKGTVAQLVDLFGLKDVMEIVDTVEQGRQAISSLK